MKRRKESWDSIFLRVLNSTLCFVAAYVLITYLFFLVTGLTGKLFDYDVDIYYYGNKFLLKDHEWTKISVSTIFMVGPFFVLIWGLFNMYLYFKFRIYEWTFNLFFLWSFVIGTQMFVSHIFISALGYGEYNSPYYINFAVFFAWWRVPLALNYLAMAPFTILGAFFGISVVKAFLSFAFTYTKVNKPSRRRRFFMQVAIIPFLAGAVITTMITFPMNMYVHLAYLGIILTSLVIGWYSIFYLEMTTDEVGRHQGLQRINIPLILFTLIICGGVLLTWRGIYLTL